MQYFFTIITKNFQNIYSFNNAAFCFKKFDILYRERCSIVLIIIRRGNNINLEGTLEARIVSLTDVINGESIDLIVGSALGELNLDS
jgi:hypothetical protein